MNTEHVNIGLARLSDAAFTSTIVVLVLALLLLATELAYSRSRRVTERQLVGAGAPVDAAAVIMIAVFAGFILNDSLMVKSIGFSLSVGVLLDAFLVRMLIIPGAMHLLGDSAWWLPKWLDKILPIISIEGEEETKK